MDGDLAASTGKVGGAILQAMGPLKMLGGRGLAAQTVGGMGVGAGLGYIMPTSEDESVGWNAGLSGLLSGVGSAVTPLVRMGVGALARPFAPLTNKGATSRARGLLTSAAHDPTSIARPSPSPIPGVNRTLAEETMDPGIAQLQRQYSAELAGTRGANDAARVAFVRSQFGGANAASADAKRAAVRVAELPGLTEAKKQTGAMTGKVLAWLDRAPNTLSFKGNTAVADALSTVRGRLAVPIDDAGRLSAARGVVSESLKTPRRMSSGDFDMVKEAQRLVISGQRQGLAADEVLKSLSKLKPSSQAASGTINDMRRALKVAERGKDDVASLYETRKVVANEMLPKALKDGDGAMAKALSGTIEKLDEQIAFVAPTYKQYLSGYAKGMREADQITVGANILKRGSRAGQNDRQLQSGRFLAATDDLNSLLPKGAQARRVKPESLLTPKQQQAIGLLRQDVMVARDADEIGRALGSPTSQNARTESLIAQELGRSRVGELVQRAPLVRTLSDWIGTIADKRLQARVVEALQNPQEARRIMAQLPSDQRRVIEAALVRAGVFAGPVAVQE